MKKTSLIERFKYWLDTQLAKGTGNMVRLLLAVTLLITFLGSLLLWLLSPDTSGIVTLWNNMTLAVNADWPEMESGEEIFWPRYIIGAVMAVAGLFITSTLIGIISSGLQNKLESLRGGRRKLLENGHAVLLGADNCELYLASAIRFLNGKSRSILVADRMDQERFDEVNRLRESLPSNISLSVKNIDITDPENLELCSIAEASSVIIHSENENEEIKTILAVSALLKEYPESKVRVVAGISSLKRWLPEESVDPRINLIGLGDTLAELILINCTEPETGLALKMIMGGEKTIVRSLQIPETAGKEFDQVISRISGAAPFAVVRDGEVYLAPGPGFVIREEDKLMCCCSSEEGVRYIDGPEREIPAVRAGAGAGPQLRKLVIIGGNSSLSGIIKKLPADFRQVVLVPKAEGAGKLLSRLAEAAGDPVCCRVINLYNDAELRDLVADADHVVLLNRDLDQAVGTDEETDTDIAVLVQRLQTIRKRENFSYYLTAEFVHKEWLRLIPPADNLNLIGEELLKPLVVSQAAMSPELRKAALLILGRKEHGIRVVPAGQYGCSGRDLSIRDMRRLCCRQGAVLIGYVISREGNKKLFMNPPLEEQPELTAKDSLVIVV